MARKTPNSKPSAFVRPQRPAEAPDANPSNHRIDELNAQSARQAHIATGRLSPQLKAGIKIG